MSPSEVTGGKIDKRSSELVWRSSTAFWCLLTGRPANIKGEDGGWMPIRCLLFEGAVVSLRHHPIGWWQPWWSVWFPVQGAGRTDSRVIPEFGSPSKMMMMIRHHDVTDHSWPQENHNLTGLWFVYPPRKEKKSESFCIYHLVIKQLQHLYNLDWGFQESSALNQQFIIK